MVIFRFKCRILMEIVLLLIYQPSIFLDGLWLLLGKMQNYFIFIRV